MKNFVTYIVSHRAGALLVLLLAAFLEVYGDSSMQKTLYRSTGMSRSVSFLIGAASLIAYGLVVNTPRWDFGKLLGVYVVLFFLLAQLIAWTRFGEVPGLPVFLGGSLIVAGGLVIAVSGK